MNRNATSHFDSFDPEVIEAARDVASRAGVPLESWIASVVPQHLAPFGDISERQVSQETIRTVHDYARAPAGSASSEGVATLMTRDDGPDRSVEAERRAAAEAEQKRLEEIELRIDRALQSDPVQQVNERLGEIERRVGQLDDQVASRPGAKRGKTASAEMREAVQAIRQRQRELSAQAEPPGTVAIMHRDLERRLGNETEASAKVASALPGYVMDELRREAVQLHETMAPLATNADIASLENALQTLAGNIARARSDAEVPALALPLAVIRTRIKELDLDEADAAHARLVANIKKFKNRLDVAIAFEEADADHSDLDVLTAEHAAIRAAAAELAAPQRLREVAARVEALADDIARIPPAEEVKPQPAQEGAPVEKVQLADEISALAEKVDSLQARADIETGARPKQAAHAASDDMASIHAMLQSLAEKVDRVGERAGPDGLDALEKQVLTLVDKIEAPSALDPALTSLEKTMNDLMRQVEALREVSPSEAVITAAAKQAVAESLKGVSCVANPGEFGLLRASLAEMQARQIASDERLSTTLEGVQSALDRLVTRLSSVEAIPASRGPSLDELLLTSTSVEAPRSPVRAPVREQAEVAQAPQQADALLEPGAPRPNRAPAVVVEKREPVIKAPSVDKVSEANGDIKTSFIAAARRAAQAAQAELAAEAPAERPLRQRVVPEAVKQAGPMSRLRSEVDQHRKPLLLGLAAVVLTLGAIQAVGVRNDDARGVPQLTPTPGTTPADKSAEAQKPADTQKTAEAPKAAVVPASQDPTTTQTVASPRPPESIAPAKPAVPQVPNMAGLAGDLAAVPAGLAKTKQAALNGEGAAVWDLAMREADGRGMPRDLATAAKLFEKLANVGYAPAQYKLAAHYEKGSGVTRDLAQAKLWYGRAAEQGHARAMHNLGVIYAENPAAGGKPDFGSAASWFRQGAEYGVRDSQYNIAVLYARGLGLTQDLVQSYVWFAAAAAQGDDDAAKKRDDVGTKLSAADLARAKSLSASFKPRRLDPAVNEPPVAADPGQGSLSLLGAPIPTAVLTQPGPRKAI